MMNSQIRFFRDRTDAGQQLASQLNLYANHAEVVVLGLPRGGVPVAFEVAKALKVPLDICLVRKLGVPEHPELAMGAIASGGVRVLNDELVNTLKISGQTLDQVTEKELRELERRDRAYRGLRPRPEILDRTVILVDDGIATGSTMRAAIASLRELKSRKIIVAVPIIARESCATFKTEAEDLIYVKAVSPLYSIGYWYHDFSQTTDTEVQALLA